MSKAGSLTPSSLLLLVIACGAVDAAQASLTLVRDRKPAATIVLSGTPTKAGVLAAVEVRDHVKKITGVTLPIVPDRVKVQGPRVLVGESAATRALGLRGEDFAKQEYLIRVTGDALILVGRDARKPYGLMVRGAPKWVAGKFGKALALDGTQDAVVVEKPGFTDAEGSMEAWVELAPGAAGCILRLDGRPWSYHIVSCAKGKIRYATYKTHEGKAGSHVDSDELSPGWHHVLATWDAAAGRIQLFVDGSSLGTARYLLTSCADANLGIGSMGHTPGRWFHGKVDEVRLSAGVRAPDVTRAPAEDASTVALLHFDEGDGLPNLTRSLSKLRLNLNALPDAYDDMATCYAAYHFLERHCGVRWYGPTELGTVTPSKPTLQVNVEEVRRKPSFSWRCVMPTHNFGRLMATVKGLWNDPSVKQQWLYLHRMRNGGERFRCTHTFYGYYDRFWHKNPKKEEAWEAQHLEWFAHGYDGKPPQLCYCNEDVVDQVVADARAFFDGQRHTGGAGEFFGLGAMDNPSFCRCLVCKKLSVPADSLKGKPHFSCGKNSDYWFTFCNRVAKKMRETHPDKYMSVLTYSTYAKHPSFPVEPNIAPQLALAGNMFLDDPTGVATRHIWGVYQEWIDREKGRPIYLWLYPEFPESWVWSRGYTSFPGFGARLIPKQMKRYARDGVRGMYPEGITTQLNEYMYNQLAFDAEQDADRIIEEFFTLYYGAAAAPMRKLWMEIEETYTDPANWPQEYIREDRDVPITEETSWRRLGTAERMSRWARYMEQAKSDAKTDAERARVGLFEQGQWVPMVEAKQLYERKAKHQAEVEALKKALPPSSRIPKLAKPAGGDLDKVDWRMGQTFKLARDVYGYPAPQRRAEVTIVHDGKHLYLRLQERRDTKKLQGNPGIFSGDDWEIFWAAQREKPYRQVGINPKGRFQAIPYGEPTAWDHGIKLVSDVEPDAWVVRMCLPMANVVPGGLKSGGTLYLNVIRSSPGAAASLAYSPHFILNFHMPERLAAFKVE